MRKIETEAIRVWENNPSFCRGGPGGRDGKRGDAELRGTLALEKFPTKKKSQEGQGGGELADDDGTQNGFWNYGHDKS